jgi:hypothetical protein
VLVPSNIDLEYNKTLVYATINEETNMYIHDISDGFSITTDFWNSPTIFIPRVGYVENTERMYYADIYCGENGKPLRADVMFKSIIKVVESTPEDHDMILIPASRRYEKIINHSIYYTNPTIISQEEYDIALDTATEILGEEVSE